MRWNDVEEICEALAKFEPPVDTRAMTEQEIVELVITLPDFEGDAEEFNAGHIEAVRSGVWWGS
ncbi:MAG: Fe-S cluster assembly protein IscX [Actinomycetota bacterium]